LIKNIEAIQRKYVELGEVVTEMAKHTAPMPVALEVDESSKHPYRQAPASDEHPALLAVRKFRMLYEELGELVIGLHKNSKRVAYVAHPLGAPTQVEVDANLERAKRWYRWACDSYPDRAFVANWIVDIEVYPGTDTDPNHPARLLGLDRDDAVVRICDEYWMVGGRISTGVGRGRDVARDAHDIIYDLTYLGTEPPDGPVELLESSR
jgi:hypothetical protein